MYEDRNQMEGSWMTQQGNGSLQEAHQWEANHTEPKKRSKTRFLGILEGKRQYWKQEMESTCILKISDSHSPTPQKI